MPVVCKRKAWLLKHLCHKYSIGKTSSTKYDRSKWVRSSLDIKVVVAKYSWVCAFEFDFIWTMIIFMSLLSSQGIIASIPATVSGPMPTSYRSASLGEEPVQNGTTIVTWLRGRPQWKPKIWWLNRWLCAITYLPGGFIQQSKHTACLNDKCLSVIFAKYAWQDAYT